MTFFFKHFHNTSDINKNKIVFKFILILIMNINRTCKFYIAFTQSKLILLYYYNYIIFFNGRFLKTKFVSRIILCSTINLP